MRIARTIAEVRAAAYSAADLADYTPTVVHVDRANEIVRVDDAVGELVSR